jgi:FkbM family methyltransferase
MSLRQKAQALGLYRPARWVHLHVLRRDSLAFFRKNERFFAKLLKPGHLAFDVGAHKGDVTHALLGIGARVVAIEPWKEGFEIINARHGHNPRLVLMRCALGSKQGRQTLHINEHPGSTSLLSDWRPDNVVATDEVSVTTLDTVIQKHGVPDYIKIDVEGFELEVLRGLSRPISLISFETSRDREGNTAMIQSCLQLLNSRGKIEINLTPAENYTFALPEWLSLEKFLEIYPRDFQDYAYRYGDVFVRSK